jgi:thiamine kinase
VAPQSLARGAGRRGACLSIVRGRERGASREALEQAPNVERLALRHVPGMGPVSLERRASGPVYQTYRVVRDRLQYALRVPAPHAAPFGADPAWECRILQAAAAAGLAPEIVCCKPRQRVLVARWVEGNRWTPEQAREPRSLKRIAALVRRVHALTVPAAARIVSPAAWIAYYQDALSRVGAQRAARSRLDLGAALEARLAALERLPHRPAVICHSDLHVDNLVASRRGLVLLDWEYAHVTEAFWDLAGWACNNDLNEESRRLLLASYLERPPGEEDAERLEHLSWLYDCVCWLWSELYLSGRAGADEVAILARAELLARRLECACGRAGQVPAH